MGRRFSRAISLTSVGLIVMLGAGCGSAGSSAPSGLDKTTHWLPEPFGSADSMRFGFQEVADLDQGATTNFPVGWYVVTKTWAERYPRTLTAFLDALKQGQEIADTDRSAVELAMEKLPSPYAVPAPIAAVMSLEKYPLSVAPDIDLSRVQRVADAMYQFRMLTQMFHVSSMLS